MGWHRTTPCERAAQWISLALDDELSVLEQAGLDRHLDRCEACHRLSAELAGLTALIRGAPPAEPRREPAVRAPRPGNRRTARRVSFVGACGVVVSALVALVTNSSSPTVLTQPSEALAFSTVQEQLTFVHEKYIQMEPRLHMELKKTTTESLPVISPRALR